MCGYRLRGIELTLDSTQVLQAAAAAIANMLDQLKRGVFRRKLLAAAEALHLVIEYIDIDEQCLQHAL